MFRRCLTAVLAAVALAGAGVAPAYADPNPPYTPTTLRVRGTTAGYFLNGLQISATCEADVVGIVGITVIDECRLYEYSPVNTVGANHPGAAPGNVAVSTFTQRVYTLDFELCFSAYTIPLHNPTQVIRTPLTCSDSLVYGSEDGMTFGYGEVTA